jgi:hypothetical protein
VWTSRLVRFTTNEAVDGRLACKRRWQAPHGTRRQACDF